MAEPTDAVEARIIEQAAYHADLMKLQRLKFLRGDVTSVLDADIAATAARLAAPAAPGGPGGGGQGQPAKQDQQTQVGSGGAHAAAPPGSGP